MTKHISTIEEAMPQLTPFIRHLLNNDKRISLAAGGFGHYMDNEDTFFVVTKEAIYLPWQFPYIEHEIAHAVEMKDKSRWTLPDWGMKMFPGTPGAKDLFAALAREVRVRAIQTLMEPAKPESQAKHSAAYDIFNNSVWIDMVKKRLPFGKFSSFEQVQAWTNSLRQTTLRNWSLDRIETEWKIRHQHWHEYMDTLN